MLTQDLDNFFQGDELATPFTVAGTTLNGIFDNAYVEAVHGMSGSTEPTLLVPDTAMPQLANGTLIQILGKTYKVIDNEPDGTGVTLLRLRSA